MHPPRMNVTRRFCVQSAAITLLFVCVIASAGLSIFSPNVVSAQSFVFLNNHQLHDRSEDIRALQAFLNSHGFTIAQHGSGSPGNETSLFGLLSYQALIRFQIAQHLPATGFFGPLTRARIASFSIVTSTASTTQLSVAPKLRPGLNPKRVGSIGKTVAQKEDCGVAWNNQPRARSAASRP
jgi:peptidoglycan hydrolase-like protein with peptidoglycan-binding domain